MSATLLVAEPNPTPASEWAKYPCLYEINTWVWLWDLSRKYGKELNLGSVPSGEWDAIASHGFDAVWLMGVWERSPAGIAIANRNPALLEDFRRSLPDFRPQDNVGSAYCIRRYVVDEHLGGPKGLATARRELQKRGMNLVLDFVPNHVAPDHPWASEDPEFFIRGTVDDLRNDPSSYVDIGGVIFACGRDPYFPAWPDVLQLNAFDPGLRRAVIQTVSSIADQCDGIRCDMAMLLINSIFQRTWGSRAGLVPATEYWREVISTIKNVHPGFLFIAEAYWDLEWELQQQGFDFCYDKKLYDRLEHSQAESIRLHLCADPAYGNKLLRFIENHDEPRAAAIFAAARHRAVAVTIATLPGIKLFHEGQFEGRTTRLPVFLRRRKDEPPDLAMQQFYASLLAASDRPVFREGEWRLCNRSGWSDNASCENIVAWTWRDNDDRYLIVVNLSDRSSQAQVQLPWSELDAGRWTLHDALSGASYEHDGHEMLSPGLYVDLSAWNYHFFHLRQQQ
jgi:glycosidase